MKGKTGKSIITIELDIVFYGIMITGIMYACLKCYDFPYLAFSNSVYQKDNGSEQEIIVKEGESDREVMLSLQRQGIVENGYAAWLRLAFSEGTIQPGQYKLNPSMPLDDILDVLSKKPEDVVQEQEK